MLLISLDSLGIRLTRASRWDVAFWLGVFAVVAMGVALPLQRGESLYAATRRGGRPMLVSGLLQAASLTFFILAIDSTTIADTVVIIAAAPVVAALIAHLAIGERASRRTWLAIGLSFAGVVLVVSGSLGTGRIVGDLFAIVAIVAFGSNLTLWRRLPELNRRAVVGLGGMVTAIVAVIAADPFSIDMQGLAILALLGLLTGPSGRVAVATSARYLPVSRVSLFIPVETIAAITWAAIFLNEPPTPLTIVGGSLVILAVVIGNTPERRSQPPRGVV